MLLIFNFVFVPFAIACWSIWRRFMATGETMARIEAEPTARRSRTSAPSSMRVDDQVSQDRQEAQANQSQRISIASSVEVPREGENQHQAPRV